MTWPSLSLHDDMVDESVSLPKYFSLTYSQARILRAAVLLPTASLRPILYSRRPGIVSPVFMRIPAVFGGNLASPSAPEVQYTTDGIPQRLYPLV